MSSTGIIGSAPCLSVPVELSNIASSMLQLAQGHEQGQELSIDEGGNPIQQSKLIYRDAIRSVQEQIRRCSRCLVAARHQEQATLVPPVIKKSKSSGPARFSTPPHNSNNICQDDIDISSAHIPPRKGILSNPQDDIWSSVPELSKARQMLDEARRGIQLNKKVAAHKNQLASLQTRPSSSDVANNAAVTSQIHQPNGEKIIRVATIGMYKHPLIIPSISSTLPEPATTSPPFNSRAQYARANKISEYISAIVLYNFALTHHLHAIQTHDLALLAMSADLYDMCIKVMHAELDGVLKDCATYYHERDACQQDPILFNFQQLARTAMGATMTNAGLIYNAFSEHDDATAVFNVLVQLCAVQSRRHARRRCRHSQYRRHDANVHSSSMPTNEEDCTDCQEQQANADTSLPISQAIVAAYASFEDERAWDHFFCAAYALRAGTIAPCA